MGYTTEFEGVFKLNKKLKKEDHEFLFKLANTRRMARSVDAKYGIEGEFFVDGKGCCGQDEDSTIIDYNRPPKTQPGLWCQWVPSSDGKGIQWDGNEKFYNYTEWLEYLIKNVLAPRGYKLSGSVNFFGEDRTDIGNITVKNNKVTVKRGRIVFESIE